MRELHLQPGVPSNGMRKPLSTDARAMRTVFKLGLALDVLCMIRAVQFYHRHPTGESALTHLGHRY